MGFIIFLEYEKWKNTISQPTLQWEGYKGSLRECKSYFDLSYGNFFLLICLQLRTSKTTDCSLQGDHFKIGHKYHTRAIKGRALYSKIIFWALGLSHKKL